MSESPDDLAALQAQIEEEEHTLILPAFAHDDAWRLGNIVVGRATERALPVTIDITRGEQRVFHVALSGTSADNDQVIEGKVRTTRRVGTSSLLARVKKAARPGLYSWLESPAYVIAGGCFPLRMAGGAMVGTLTISGLPDADDHALAVESVRAYLAES